MFNNISKTYPNRFTKIRHKLLIVKKLLMPPNNGKIVRVFRRQFHTTLFCLKQSRSTMPRKYRTSAKSAEHASGERTNTVVQEGQQGKSGTRESPGSNGERVRRGAAHYRW